MSDTPTPAPRRKTVQALKVLASWTPTDATALVMTTGVFAETPAWGVRFSSGRLSLRAAFLARYEDAEYTARVSAAIASLKAELGERGILHDFTIVAGAVDPGETVVVDVDLGEVAVPAAS
jgi:hypothetical protein